jgi:hypothetical protein
MEALVGVGAEPGISGLMRCNGSAKQPVLTSSGMIRATPSPPAGGRLGLIIGALLLGGIGIVALVLGAADGNTTVASFSSPAQASAAELTNAYYRCLDVQTRSLVAPEQPVTFDQRDNVADLLRASGSWLHAAPATDRSVPQLLLTTRAGPGSCHGFVVEARTRDASGRTELRIGSGASVPGHGPLPRPEL